MARYLPLLLALLLVTTGCGYRQKHVLFQTEKRLIRHGFTVVHVPGPEADVLANATHEHVVVPGDRIQLKFLNNYDISSSVTIAGTNKEEVTFLVDVNGNVVLPMVGTVKVSGKTRQQIAAELQDLYSKDFKDPKIEVVITGMRVSIMGEITTPGVYPIETEDQSLVDVIAKAGGITTSGNARNVRLMRKSPGGDSTTVLIYDLTNVDVLQEDALVLRDKDIIVVEPTNIRIVTLALQPYYGLLTLVSTVATMAVLVIQLTRPSGTTN